MKNTTPLFSACALLAALLPAAVAGAGDAGAVRGLLSASAPAPVPEPAAPEKAGKEWTIMVFMNGKNDLSNFALNDLNEMEQEGSPENVNLVVETGRRAPPAPAHAPFGFPDFPDIPGMAMKARKPVLIWAELTSTLPTPA